MEALEWSQQISHYKAMGIFKTSDLAKFRTHISFYSWPCYLQERRRSSRKCRRESGHNIIDQFLRRSRVADSIIGDVILKKYNLIQAFIVVLLICKNEEDQFKIESSRVVTIGLPI